MCVAHAQSIGRDIARRTCAHVRAVVARVAPRPWRAVRSSAARGGRRFAADRHPRRDDRLPVRIRLDGDARGLVRPQLERHVRKSCC